MPAPNQQSKGRRLGRWILLAAVALAALAGASVWLGDFVWHRADSRTVVFWVYLGWMALILLSAAAVSALLVRLLFPAQEGVLPAASGRKTAGPEEEEFLEIKRTSALFHPVTIYYSLFVVLTAVGAMFLADALSGGALYRFKTAQLEAMTRSGEPLVLQALFAEIREMQHPEEVEHFVHKLPAFVEHPDEAVRAAALNTVAVMAHRMNLSVYLLNEQGQLLGDRWEPGLIQWMHQELSPQLKRFFRRGGTPRPGIVHALARIANPDDFDFFATLAADSTQPDEVFVPAAIGLGNLGDLKGAQILVDALPHRKGLARLRLLWALERIGNSIQPDPDDAELEARVRAVVEPLAAAFQTLDDAALCAAARAAGSFQHDLLVDPVIELFESDRGNLICPRVEMTEPTGPPVLYVEPARLRWLLLNVLADLGAGNDRVRHWVNAALTRDYHPEVMKGLRQLDSQFMRQE